MSCWAPLARLGACAPANGIVTCLNECVGPTIDCYDQCYRNSGWLPPLTTAELIAFPLSACCLLGMSLVISCMMSSTLGLDMATLQAAMDGVDERLRWQAARVASLRTRGSLLLTTLLVASTSVNVSFTLFVSDLPALEKFELCNTYQLSHLPDSFGQLKNLRTLKLLGCNRLTTLPPTFPQLSSLESFKLISCELFSALTEDFSQLPNLQELSISWCPEFRELPSSFTQLSSLTHFTLSCCRNFSVLPEGIGHMSNLKSFELTGCDRLTRLPQSLALLCEIERLEISGCSHIVDAPLVLCDLIG
ncbi:hypothetical protein CLOM_g8262 [Closterium sp. NIES-68]|nr:hypothetical protein CLOM_g8262 [Closterium sp. NIES-68]